jgi:hypothetical protein
MTLKKIDYSKLVVYKIVCKDLSITDLYVGSTTNFDQRKKQHKNRCYNQNSEKYHYLLYQTIRKYGGFENWEMIIVERCPCDNSYDARKFERFYFEQLKANLNMLKPLRTDEERKQMNKEYKQKEQYKENQKIYRNTLSEERKAEIQLRDKERKQSEYYKNYMKEYRKQYTEEHRDKINGKKREKIICSCGVTISKASKSKHLISQKHIEYMNKSS